MQLLAQIPMPDPTPVIQKAASVSWEATMLAFIMVVFMSVIVYMIKRQNDQALEERKNHAERESRMAKRIDDLEDESRKVESAHSVQLVALIKEVTIAIMKSNETQLSTSLTIQTLVATMNEVNGDIKELCQLIRMSPCLLTGCGREGYKLVDKQGREVKLSETKIERT